MARKAFDGIIEAVRYDADGRLELARVYERRGAIYSDVVLLTRPELVSRLRNRKKYLTGNRLPRMGCEFETGLQARLVKNHSGEWVVVCDPTAESDNLEPAPIF